MSNRLKKRPRGMQLVEIKPVIFGEDPVDPQNKAWVTRQQHFEIVRYWNKVLVDYRKQQNDQHE
jgi:hypothetical protein